MNYKWLVIVLVLAILPIVAFYLLSFTSGRPANLGVKDGKLLPCPTSPNCVSTQADDEGHRIEPIRFQGGVLDAKTRIKQALAALPRTAVVTETDDYLHVECTSLIFRFVDDIEFWFDSATQTIHFRSASRAGKSDFGVNRARMEVIRKVFAGE